MNIKLIAYFIYFLPFIQGIILLICCKNDKLKLLAKYKKSENYTYINKLFATAYLALGGVLGIFCSTINYMFNIYTNSIKGLFIPIGVILVAKLFIDTIVNVRLQVDEYDKNNSIEENKDK